MKDIRLQFPIFQSHPNVVYLDSAASTQTPQGVLDAMDDYYRKYRANIHRGLYDLSASATEKYEQARQKVADFIGAEKNEIIFTSGTTHGLNVLARGLCKNLKAGDNIVLTSYEHHANLVPWQEYAREKGIELRFVEIKEFELDLDSAKNLIDNNTKVVSFGLVSNTLGTIAPSKKILALAKDVGATTVIDAAQAVAHMPLNVKEFDCDFLVFSGHKMYGPTGIGVLYGKKERLDHLEPFFYGGDKIREVTYEKASWADIPERFEGGTPNIAGAIGLGAAVDFIESIGFETIQAHEQELTKFMIEQLSQIEGLHIIGTNNLQNRIGVVSFIIDKVHPHDIAEVLNRDQVCIRAGHHCAMPLMKKLNLSGTNRISIGMYNTEKDIEKLLESIQKVKTIFK